MYSNYVLAKRGVVFALEYVQYQATTLLLTVVYAFPAELPT